MTPQKTLPIFAPPKIKDGENFPKKQIVQRDFLGTWSFPPHDLDNEKPPGWVLEVFGVFLGKQRKYVVLEETKNAWNTGKMFLKLKIVFFWFLFFSI